MNLIKNKPLLFAIVLPAIVIAGIAPSIFNYYYGSIFPQKESVIEDNVLEIEQNQKTSPEEKNTLPVSEETVQKNIFDPIDNANTRITKKPFGKYVTPQNSPVSPERFTGYHTGTDFEIMPGEEDSPIAVSAICDGEIVAVQYIDGYGGVIVESCTINEEAVTVLYGHQDISAQILKVGLKVSGGDKISILAPAYSYYSGGERKHLHLGIHKGTAIEWRGYVGNPDQLSGWINWEDIY